MKSGLAFFHSRPSGNDVDLTELENALGIALPPLYKLFIQTYVLGEDQLALDYYFNKDVDMPLGLCSPNYAPGDPSGAGELEILDFYSHNKIQQLWQGYEQLEPSWTRHKLLRIGMFAVPACSAIYLGLGDHNADEIWRLSWDWGGPGEDSVRIANNIFEFARGLETDTSNEHADRLHEQAFMKWGDKYWTLKGQQD